MNDQFSNIKTMYEKGFNEHGDSSAALLTPKGRQAFRFRSIDPFLKNQSKSLFDYGCGLGYLYEYCIKKEYDVAYHGVDIVPQFIETCRHKFKNQVKQAKFDIANPTEHLTGSYDVVFSSGVFNIRLNDTEENSKAYVFNKLEELFSITKNVMICDFLSPFVDYKQEDSLHFSIDEIANFCAQKLSRRFVIHHNFLPYEYSLIVYKDANIRRPDNFYETDADLIDF